MEADEIMSLSTTKKPVKPSTTSSGSISTVKQACPKIEYELVELVEVVTQNKEKWVKGATEDANDTSVFDGSVPRPEKDGKFRQYINLKRDTEGKNNRHPEYGREITFKARIKRKDNKTEKLDGVKVTFKNKCTKAANRSTPDATVWSDANLKGDQKEGFGSKNGTAETSVQTRVKGWTSSVSFFMSQYGGDQFEISAELHPDVEGSSGAKPKKTKEYVVWRKFWYQMTYAKGFAVVQPTKAEEAYKEVFAEMVKSPKKEFEEGDLPEDLKKRTFLEEYQVKKGGGDANVAVIGAHNKNEFVKKKFYKKDDPKGTPLKANLIICEYQCDPSTDDNGNKTYSALGKFELKANGGVVTLEPGSGGSIVCMPALRPGCKLIVKGEWSKTDSPWNKGGNIIDKCIEIYKTRPETRTVKVDLSKGATATTGAVPVPSISHPVFVKLKVETAESFLGESFGKGQILCVYRPGADNAKPTQANKQDYNNTVAHELGHMWNQTPEPNNQPDSMKNHPLQYVAHGGSGSHCRHGMQSLYDKDGNVSEDVDTTITKKADPASDTHEVTSTAHFYKDHKVKVKGSEKTVKKVTDGTHLKFTSSFTSEIGDKVVQKMSDYPVNWNDSTKKEPKPYNGDCMMYHSFSKKCSNKFCKTCKPYLQLQDMSAF